MLVFWKERLVFFAVPKTGTTALEGAMSPKASVILRDPPILKHVPVYRFRRFVLPLLDKAGPVDDLETVAVVRDPIDWLSSWYRYRHPDDLAGHPNSTRGVTFEQFVQEYMKPKPARFANVGSQAKFLGDKESIIGVTHLFKYEALDRAREFFEERLETTLNINTLNVSPQMELELSAATRRDFERECALEYDVWSQGIG